MSPKGARIIPLRPGKTLNRSTEAPLKKVYSTGRIISKPELKTNRRKERHNTEGLTKRNLEQIPYHGLRILKRGDCQPLTDQGWDLSGILNRRYQGTKRDSTMARTAGSRNSKSWGKYMFPPGSCYPGGSKWRKNGKDNLSVGWQSWKTSPESRNTLGGKVPSPLTNTFTDTTNGSRLQLTEKRGETSTRGGPKPHPVASKLYHATKVSTR